MDVGERPVRGERPVSGARGARTRLVGGIRGRLVLATTALTVIVAAAFAFLIYSIVDLRDAGRLARDARQELIALDVVEKLVLDLETGLRGFVITEEERFLEPWNEARRALPGEISQLEGVLEGDPALASRVRAIAASITSYIRDYGTPLVEAVRRGDASARSVAVTAEGKARLDELRTQMSAVTASQRAAITARQERADSASRWALIAGAVALAGCVALLVLFAVYLMRVIVAPIRHAATMADRIAQGDLAARVPTTGVGEIGVLERSFNAMAGSLEASRDELAERAAEQAALRRVATLVARGTAPDVVFAAMAEEVGQLLGADISTVVTFHPDGTATVLAVHGVGLAPGAHFTVDPRFPIGRVRQTGSSARVDLDEPARANLPDDVRLEGVRSSVATPIVVEGRTWGAIRVSSRESLPHDIEQRLADFTELSAMAIANAESRAQLAASRARVVAAADESRRRIERDLHDGAQQRLVGLALRLRGVTAAVPEELPGVRRDLERAGSQVDEVLEELRELSRGLHPAILSEGGLVPALRTLARRSPVPVALDLDDVGRLRERTEIAAYFVVSEALANAAKHANASQVDVNVAIEANVLRLSIRDDGIGGADPDRGSGLIGLRDRVEAVGGRITVDSPIGGGTTLIVEIPADPSEEPLQAAARSANDVDGQKGEHPRRTSAV